jgi:hypothetical protein
MTNRAARNRETATAAIELVVGVALIMVPMAMIVLSFAPLLEARTFVRLASSELARTVAITDGDEALAYQAIRDMAVNNNIDPARVDVALCGGAEGPLSSAPQSTCTDIDGLLERGTYVTVFMRVTVDVFPLFTDGFTIAAGYEHAELVDQYRSIPQP